MIAFTKMSKLEKQGFDNMVDELKSITSPKIYFAIYNSLKPSDETVIRPIALAQHYFYRLKESCLQSRIDREHFYKAVQFNKYKLYVKHFYAFINYTADRL